jgi:LIVCS family branched-chain amino acid:cation transporter
MKNKAIVLSTGLAMFSMFFGSGNLVFPILVGQMSGGHTLAAALGILLTGVLVPFLGVYLLYLFNGDSRAFFSRMGPKATFWFPLLALSLMGPFGVLARCITVAHGAYRLLFPDTTLWAFSLASCAVIFFLTIRRRKIVALLGSILTPLLLLSLAFIAFSGLTHVQSAPMTLANPLNSFINGVFQGYQTMDLLAAFFFSAFVLKYLRGHDGKTFLSASFIGASLLSIVYAVLVLLGSAFAPQLQNVPPQEMFGQIAILSLGTYAAPIVCTAVILACLTTAIVLTSLFSDFLKKDIAREKIADSTSLILTLGIAFGISTLEFAGIMKIIGPILEWTYPGLIAFTIFLIFNKIRRNEMSVL